MNMTCLQPNKPKTVFWRYRCVLTKDTKVIVHPVVIIVIVVVVDAAGGWEHPWYSGLSTSSEWWL